MKNKVLAIGKSFIWCFVILLFPIISGALSVILSLNTVETLFLQGCFMLISLIPPVVFILTGKWHWKEIGFAEFDFEGYKRALYFIPLIVIFIPVAVMGFHIESIVYVSGSLFLYLFVGISEEIYFRGIIPKYLKEEFSAKGVVILSAFIFAIGHIAAALSGNNLVEIILTVLNALLFGFMVIEMTMLSKNIIPAILVHFIFDFETKFVVMSGRQLLIAEIVRGTFIFIAVIWLAAVIYKDKDFTL